MLKKQEPIRSPKNAISLTAEFFRLLLRSRSKTFVWDKFHDHCNHVRIQQKSHQLANKTTVLHFITKKFKLNNKKEIFKKLFVIYFWETAVSKYCKVKIGLKFAY